MTKRQYAHYSPAYTGKIRAIARKFAGSDDHLFEDLVQVGCLAMWLLKPGCAKVNVGAYIGNAAKFRMIDHLRKMRPFDYWPLDAFLEDGHDLIYDDSTGEVRMTWLTGDRRHGGINWAVDPQLRPREEYDRW